MAAPSKSFTVIADSDIDPDSPITTGLMTAFRDNDIHLEEWLGKDYTAATNHDHDGANSALISALGGGALRLVESKDVAATVSSLTFSGITGDSDEVYVLVGHGLLTGSAGARILELQPNGLTASQKSDNYLGSTATTTTMVLGEVSAVDEGVMFNAILWAPTGSNRHMISHWVNPTAAAPNKDTHVSVWSDTSTGITSLKIVPTAGSIKTGTKISLYKMLRA